MTTKTNERAEALQTKVTELIQTWVHENNFLFPGEQLQVTVSIIRPPPAAVSVIDSSIGKNVRELTLSSRASNILNNANIESVGQLRLYTFHELLRYRDCGPASIAEFRRALALECGGLAIENMPVWTGKELEDLGLAMGGEHRLRNVGIASIKVLTQTSEKELLEKGVGRGLIRSIKSRLRWLEKSLA